MSNSQISFYVDTLLVETVLADPKLYKKAGFVTDILTRVKDYFESKVDKEHPVSSVLNMLAPGALWLVFKGLGIGNWGLLIGLLMNVFHVDAKGILESLYDKVKGMISGGGKVSEQQIDEAVASTAQEHMKPADPSEVQKGYQTLQSAPQVQQANDGKVYSSLELLHDAKLIRLALIQYDSQNMRLTKSALDFKEFTNMFSDTKSKGTSLLSTIFGWIIKIALVSAGLMVAGDLIRKLFGMDDDPSKPSEGGGGKSTPVPEESGPVATQTKFPAKGNGPVPRSLPLINNDANIENIVIQFAKDVYSGLDGKENAIRSTPGFQMIVHKISWYNSDHKGSALTFIPPNWSSKKQLVDYFIDDVAKSA